MNLFDHKVNKSKMIIVGTDPLRMDEKSIHLPLALLPNSNSAAL